MCLVPECCLRACIKKVLHLKQKINLHFNWCQRLFCKDTAGKISICFQFYLVINSKKRKMIKKKIKLLKLCFLFFQLSDTKINIPHWVTRIWVLSLHKRLWTQIVQEFNFSFQYFYFFNLNKLCWGVIYETFILP